METENINRVREENINKEREGNGNLSDWNDDVRCALPKLTKCLSPTLPHTTDARLRSNSWDSMWNTLLDQYVSQSTQTVNQIFFNNKWDLKIS